jgi:hypothetical protein
VTLRELNRATLARQLLLARARVPVARAVERIGGIQAQDLGAPYRALAARIEGFRPELLDRALARRTVVKATLMRGTLHIVSARDYPYFVAALLPSLQRQYARARLGDAPATEIEALAARATAFASEPRTNAELRDHLGGEDAWFRARFHAPFVFVPPLAQRRVVAADGWLGEAPVGEEEGLAHLVRQFLAAFGPATAKDAARWARLPVGQVRAALERVRTVDLGDGLLDLPRAPRPGEVKAPPRLLALFESILLAYDDRSRFLSDEAYARVMLGGLVLQAFLLDGFVAGTWRLERGKVELDPFAPLPLGARRQLEAEARRTAAALGV